MKPVHISKAVDRSVDVSVNPYKEALTQEVDGHLHEEPSLEMKKCDLAWSILSTVIDYTTIRDNSPYVEMNTSNPYNKLQEDKQLISGDSSDQWDERFEEVTCSLHYSHKFDDTNDVSTTYLGSYMAKEEPRTFPVDNHIPFDGRGMSKAYLSNGTPMKLFFDSGASRSYLSKRFYDSNPVLHDMPKFVTTCTGIRIGNGSIVPALFVIPILFMACGHTFEIFTIVAEIDDDMDLVFGFKNMVETEGMLNTRTGEYDFIGRSIPIFPQNDLDVPVGEKAWDSSDQWDERFEEVTCSLHYSHKFDDTNDVSTTYLGSYMAKEEPRTFPVDNHIPFDGRGMSKAYLSNGTPMKLFFDSGASRSYLSKRFYDSNPVLHDMPKFVTTCTGIRIGNGSIVPALFVIPILFMACGHTFEIFTIVAEIDDDMDLVFGFKNMVETEGMLNTRTGEYDFIGRSIPIFPQNDLDVPVGEKAYIKVKAPFCDKLSGMICTKFFGRDMVYTLRVKFQDNQGVVQFRNGSNETAQLRKDKAVGILDLRSIGYFKVGYQKMVNMAESSKTFKMYHYKQIKYEAKTEDWPTSDQYMKATGRYGNGKSRKIQDSEKQMELGREPDQYPWLA